MAATSTSRRISEPYGTSPLPTSVSAGSPVRVFFDENVLALQQAQQPQTQNITKLEAVRSDLCLNGTLLDVNQHFIVYGVKNGLIRILHRHSTLRALFRSHKGQNVTDIRFFQNGDVLASAGHSNESSSVMIWRVFERSPDILYEVLLEITTTKFTIMRIIWHPFNPNQFWMIHSNGTGKMIATLVETTRITTHVSTAVTSSSGGGVDVQSQHAVCDFYDDYTIMQGAVQLRHSSDAASNLTDLSWSARETRHVLTTHDTGEITLWDLKKLSPSSGGDTVVPARLFVINEGDSSSSGPLSRCLFLPHDNAYNLNSGGDGAGTTALTSCFVTASDNNRVLTLWSPFTTSGDGTVLPTKLQAITFESPSPSYLVHVCSGPAPADASPPSCFIVVAARDTGKLFAFSLKGQWNVNEEGISSNGVQTQQQPPAITSISKKALLLVGCDYVVPFVTKYPTYAWSVVVAPTTDIAEEELSEQGGGLIFDMQLFCYQSSSVQTLTLTALSCLPPENSWSE